MPIPGCRHHLWRSKHPGPCRRLPAHCIYLRRLDMSDQFISDRTHSEHVLNLHGCTCVVYKLGSFTKRKLRCNAYKKCRSAFHLFAPNLHFITHHVLFLHCLVTFFVVLRLLGQMPILQCSYNHCWRTLPTPKTRSRQLQARIV